MWVYKIGKDGHLKISCSDFEKSIFLLKISLISCENHNLLTEFEHRDGFVIAEVGHFARARAR
jgi:lipocalin